MFAFEPLRSRVLLTLVFLGACEGGGDEGTDDVADAESGDTQTGDTDETDTGNPIPGCECILDEDFQPEANDAPSMPTCGENLCPQIEVGDEDVVANPEAVDCALTALRDRTPGIITWHYSINIGQYQNTGYLLITEDGRGIQRSWGPEDKSYVITDAVLGDLPSVDTYDACLADTDPTVKYYCVRMPVTQDTVCDEGPAAP